MRKRIDDKIAYLFSDKGGFIIEDGRIKEIAIKEEFYYPILNKSWSIEEFEQVFKVLKELREDIVINRLFKSDEQHCLASRAPV